MNISRTILIGSVALNAATGLVASACYLAEWHYLSGPLPVPKHPDYLSWAVRGYLLCCALAWTTALAAGFYLHAIARDESKTKVGRSAIFRRRVFVGLMVLCWICSIVPWLSWNSGMEIAHHRLPIWFWDDVARMWGWACLLTAGLPPFVAIAAWCFLAGNARPARS